MFGSRNEALDGGELDEPARVHDSHALRHLCDYSQIMSDEQYRHAVHLL